MLILILKGVSQYEGTRTFADLAADAMREAGHSVQVRDLIGVPDIVADLEELAGRIRPDLVFTINVLGEYRFSSGLTMTQLFGAPHVVWHTDYIFNHWDRLVGTPPETGLLMVDPTQIDAVHLFYGRERHPNIRFLPHPSAGSAVSDEDIDAYAARPIPVLWSGTFQKPEKSWANAPAETRKLFERALERALAVEWAPPHEIFDQVLAEAGVDLDNRSSASARTACWHVDAMVRMTRRFAFIKALAKTGLPLTICGEGWESQLYRFRNVTYLGATPMPRVVELMRQSRVVLNTNGNFGGGSHERPFTALMSGALPFTDVSRYYEQVFEDGRDIAMYRWLDLPAGFRRLQELVADPAGAHAMVVRGKAKAEREHTWGARLPIILESARAAGLGVSAIPA